MVNLFKNTISCLEILEHTIESSKIDKQIKIAVLSDFHLYKNISSRLLKIYTSSISGLIEKHRPDFFALTGDYVDHNKGIPLLPAILQELKAKHGVFAVLGNHDYYQYSIWHMLIHPFFRKNLKKAIDTEKIEKVMKDHKVMLLRNQTASINIESIPVNISGIDAASTLMGEPLPLLPEKEGFNIVLSHYPDLINKMNSSHIDLFIAGHTHGGLIKVRNRTIYKNTRLPIGDPHGLLYINNIPLVITKGLGTSRELPVRFGINPDITLLTVKPR